MYILDNGDVIPNHLQCNSIPDFNDGQAFSNNLLRIGEVQAIIYPDNPKSFSKKVIEYSVFTQHRANGTAVTRMYEHCVLINPFSGLADKAVWTLRPSSSANKQGANGLGLGSKVLILCINAETNNAVIIGGIRDQKDNEDLDAKDLGHFLEFIFNGIKVFINKDGELSITYTGQSKDDGTVADGVNTNKTGTEQTFLKDGSWNINVKGPVNINSDEKCIIKSTGVELGDATDKMLMGSIYRQNEQQLHSQLISGLQTAITSLNIAGAQLNIAATALAASPAAGAAPGTAAAGAAILASVQGLSTMVSAINSFESSSQQYLSNKNKLDT